jgi:pyruvate,water dikinase
MSQNPVKIKEMIVSIYDEMGLDPSKVGGKGLGLARIERAIRPLKEKGLPVEVPPAIVLTPEFVKKIFTSNPALREIIIELDSAINDNRTYYDELKEIREILGNITLDRDLTKILDSAIAQIREYMIKIGKNKNQRVAVRSSGLAEDLPGASFAGQYSTELNVPLEREGLFKAIIECTTSVWSNRVVDYRSRNRKVGLPIPSELEILDKGAFTIIIQSMVDSQWSGVGFSIDSETGHPNIIKFNIIWGLGELGVQGVVPTVEGWGTHKSDQHTLIFGQSEIETTTHSIGLMPPRSQQKQKLVFVQGEGNRMIPVTEKSPSIVTRAQADLISIVIDELSKEYDMAIDVEFCWEQGILYIVQMRPETVHAIKKEAVIETYVLTEEPKSDSLIATGLNVGTKIARGPLLPIKFQTDPSNLPTLIRYTKRLLEKLSEIDQRPILYTDMTSPPWEPVMNLNLVQGICTEEGNRTSHPAIVCREAGIASGVGMRMAPEDLSNLETRLIGVTCRECEHSWFLESGDEREIRKSGQCPSCGGRLFTLRLLEWVTLDCSFGEARLYRQDLDFDVRITKIEKLPDIITKVAVNCGSPPESLKASQIPGATKVGLAREEFISAWINLHPKFAIVADHYNNGDGWIAPDVEELYQGQKSLKEEWIQKLELGVAMETASFYPRDVILRTSDFKTNEYESLVGAVYYHFRCPAHGEGIGLKRLERCPECGSPIDSYEVRIEPKESNPMLGWRGASRYLDPDFKDAFEMELEGILRVYKRYKNLILMIPFIRHPIEAKNVTEYVRSWFEKEGESAPKIIIMAEVPSITLEPDAFHEFTDGYSFGTNDLTQLVTGSDRDSPRLLFNENIASVKRAISILADSAHTYHKPKELGVCGQAPSDIKEFIEFLVVYVDYISVNPDVIISTVKTVSEVENNLRELIEDHNRNKKEIAKALSMKFGIQVSEKRVELLIKKLNTNR